PNRQPRPLYQPTSDGCSVPSALLTILGPPQGLHYSGDKDNPAGGAHTQFKGACDNHDICWGTCLKFYRDDDSNREFCNQEFTNDLHHVCFLADLEGDPEDVVHLCDEWADYYSDVVNNNVLGIPQRHYVKAQKDACV